MICNFLKDNEIKYLRDNKDDVIQITVYLNFFS